MALFVSSGNVSSWKNANVKKNLLDGIGLTDEGRVMTDVLKVFQVLGRLIDRARLQLTDVSLAIYNYGLSFSFLCLNFAKKTLVKQSKVKFYLNCICQAQSPNWPQIQLGWWINANYEISLKILLQFSIPFRVCNFRFHKKTLFLPFILSLSGYTIWFIIIEWSFHFLCFSSLETHMCTWFYALAFVSVS